MEKKVEEEKKVDDYTSVIIDGVEVIDAKAVSKEKFQLDKFGIPITKNRLNWDKI